MSAFIGPEGERFRAQQEHERNIKMADIAAERDRLKTQVNSELVNQGIKGLARMPLP